MAERKFARLAPITPGEWEVVNSENKFFLDDFLTNSTELSPQSRKTYASNLRIWFVWVANNLGNKSQLAITSLDYKRYQNWLQNRGCSSSDISIKRAAISSLNNYIEVYYQDRYPMFRNFINRSIKRPAPSFVHEKEPLTKAEFDHLIKVLQDRNEYQKVAYLMFTFETGCRRAESRQLEKSIVEAKPTVINKSVNGVAEQVVIYQTPLIRCKGAGETGKLRKLTFSQRSMDAIKAWLEVRGEDDCPYVFVTKDSAGQYRQASDGAFNTWSTKVFTPIVGRRFHPHILRESRATQAVVEEGKDIRQVQKLLGHNDSSTTEIYIVRHDEDDLEDMF